MNAYGMEEEERGPGLGAMFGQLPSIFWQRRWYLLVPLLLGAIAATATAFLLPTKYESSAMMLVQSPSLPEDVIGDVSGAIDRRIEAIRQQIINRPRLVAMIEANSLYPDEREDKPLSEIIETMREAITLVPEQADLGSNNPEDRTIAVRLAFEYPDAMQAQAVAQQLMEQVLELNSSTNTTQRTQTVQFLTDQQAALQRQIDEAEAEVAALNARYGGVLASANSAMIGGGSSMTYDMQIASLERDNVSLRTQKRNLESADRRDPGVVAAEARLAAARAIYSESHPDVVIARRLLAEAQELAKQNVAELPVESIDRQIAFNDNQIATLRAAKARDAAQMSSVLAQRSQVPLIEQQAAQKQQRLEGLYNQFQQVSDRLLAARAGARADEEQMGERLLVIDPPVVPDKPSSPDRPLIIAIGLAAGLGLGLVLAIAIELFLRPIRDPAAIAAVTGMRPLAMVPVISAKTERAKRGWFRGRQPARSRAKSRESKRFADG